MTTTIRRADLLDAHSDEVLAALRGLTPPYSVEYDDAAAELVVTVRDEDADAAVAALASFVPERARGERSLLTADLREHVAHLRDYRMAVRSGSPVTTAQTTHVLADVIDVLRLMLDDRLG